MKLRQRRSCLLARRGSRSWTQGCYRRGRWSVFRTVARGRQVGAPRADHTHPAQRGPNLASVVAAMIAASTSSLHLHIAPPPKRARPRQRLSQFGNCCYAKSWSSSGSESPRNMADDKDPREEALWEYANEKVRPRTAAAAEESLLRRPQAGADALMSYSQRQPESSSCPLPRARADARRARRRTRSLAARQNALQLARGVLLPTLLLIRMRSGAQIASLSSCLPVGSSSGLRAGADADAGQQHGHRGDSSCPLPRWVCGRVARGEHGAALAEESCT